MRVTRRIAVTAAAAALIVGGLSAPAQAGPDLYGLAAIPQALGDTETAGSYLDRASGKMVVNVTTAAAAERVRASGATPRLVARSAAQLNAIKALDPGVVGTAWSIDPITNQVVVDVDESVIGEKLTAVQAAVAKSGGGARIEPMKGLLTKLIAGGNAIYTGGSRCSLGFNVRSGSTYYFITAGHCTNIGSQWRASSGGSVIGNRAGTSFPTNDYGIVQFVSSYTNRPGTIANGQDITSAGNAFVGQSVRRHGSTTGNRGGSVTGLNATVNYAQGSVYQMIRTNVCAEPGDSGGPLYAGSVALGLTSGGSGNCSSGGTTFFQPVPEVLSRYGVAVF